MATQADTDRLAHESLLKELHNIDNIAEEFFRTSIFINAALLAFISTLRTQQAILISFIVGLAISIVMIFKAYRHRHIFVFCYKRIKNLEKRLGTEAVRDFPSDKRFLLCWPPDGFSLLGWFGIVFTLLWIGIFLGLFKIV